VSQQFPADLSEFNVPGRSRGLVDALSYRYLLRLLIRKGTLTRYHGSVLGWVWSYVKPAAQFIVFYLVFGFFLGLNRGIDNFPIYLFSGMIAINLFGEAFGNATRSIVDNTALVQKIFLPRELFPVSAVIVAFVHFLPQVAILIVVCLLYGWVPTVVGVASILLGMTIVVTLAIGLGLLFGAINVAFRDAQNLVELILLFATWTSPVLYAWTMVADKVAPWMFSLYLANPLTSAVELFHAGFWYSTTSGSLPQPPNLLFYSVIGLLISLVILAIGQLVFKRLEGHFAQNL
jgi:ABC-2 type transport system permease protein